ncbi:MAG: Asp-tRNA(Asn)/Glu-tRNA(Gln) amidotransferase GatCAB subunit A, partial [Gammaproteobacteria bacterium]|nr:Asp-tRNA(Asn)/Glu-tRNA(Gln) amidotransferase GatCAB subunit A [Gammaproteobacteria bacterium]
MHKTIKELQTGLAQGDFSSAEITADYLTKIKQLNPDINAYITVTEEQALQQAKAADQLIADGKATALTGVPLAHKDIFCTDGVVTSCGSRMLENFKAPYNANVIEKFESQNSVMLGKTNMDEFAM